ncbi:DUF5658 family protein [Paenibacillus sp. KR2-11]|uniref:DUF5658 family protein n=1 Tax=Paenibacillus sp. KR2-11 TaxID=3385500 RepID=UPI0038FD1498
MPVTRWLMIFLVAAGAADAFMTDFGLQAQMIEEANPLMRFLYENAYLLFYLVKIGLPVLLFILMRRVKRTYIQRLLIVPAVVYAGVLVLHSFWFSAFLLMTFT